MGVSPAPEPTPPCDAGETPAFPGLSTGNVCPKVSSLERRYEQAINLALDLARQPIQTLEARYVEELQKLAEHVQQGEDLEGALLVRDEIETFAEEKPRDFSARPELARLRAVYEESRARIEAEVLEKQANVGRQTIEQLERTTGPMTTQEGSASAPW